MSHQKKIFFAVRKSFRTFKWQISCKLMERHQRNISIMLMKKRKKEPNPHNLKGGVKIKHSNHNKLP